MPAGYGIGDHRFFVINFAESNVIGISQQKVVRPTSRCLNTKIPRVAAEYARILEVEEKVLAHRLIERMGAAHQKSNSKASAIKRLNKLDKELGQYMRHAERKCCKIVGSYPIFSRSIPVDSSDASLSIPAQVSRRADKEQRQSQTCCSAMSNHGRHVTTHQGNLSLPQGMC